MTVGSFFARRKFAPGIFLASVLLLAESQPPGTPMTSGTRHAVWETVVDHLRQRGLAEHDLPRIEDLDLPGVLPALGKSSLRISSSCWDERPQRTQFRLECGEPGQCLPFLVYFPSHMPDSENADVGKRPGLCRPGLGSIQRIPQPQSAPAPSPKPTVRVGDRATAVFLSGYLRMSASVTCLDRGHQGEVIRVRSQNGQIFRARISGPDLIEALPQ